MADPINIGVALAAIGGLASAVGAIQQGQAASAAASANAQIAQRNATLARATAAQDAAAQDRQNRQRLGAIAANIGASGVAAAGTPIDILAESARQGELDKQTILFRGELRALGFQDNAALERNRGANARRTGFFRAGSALLSAGSSVAGIVGGGGGGTPLGQPGVSLVGDV